MNASVAYVDVEDPGQRIDNYLMRVLKPVPKARIYRMLRRGEVRVNGGRVKPTYRVQAGDRIRVPPVRGVPPWSASAAHRPLHGLPPARVLFEDKALLVLDKPAGLAVHGGSGVTFGLIEALRALRLEPFLELAHRLDRETSGCLILVKSRSALKLLHSMQRERAIVKSYDLLVAGRWPRALNRVDLPLYRYVTASGERRVRVADHGKPSCTRFRNMGVAATATWLRARLQTGRTHQIRVHATASGHPILGDDKYATRASAHCSRQGGARRLCLHASQLQFEWEGRRLCIEAPLPAAFATVWWRLSGAMPPTNSG